jgi:hypothetical protein
LSAAFISDLYHPQIPKDVKENTRMGRCPYYNELGHTAQLKKHYSFGWWIGNFEGRKREFINMMGRSRSYLIVDPHLDLVIVVMNGDKNLHYPSAKRYLDAVEDSLK